MSTMPLTSQHRDDHSPIGILLANTGTPNDPSPRAVRRFLREFLSDPRVIDYPRWLWLPILYGVILNLRPRRSARLYQQIWTREGSPILEITRRLAEGLRASVKNQTQAPIEVSIGMRYGDPSISSALRELKQRGVWRFLVLPLFPQFSGTTTASILDAVYTELGRWRDPYQLRTVPHYYHQPAYIRALANSLQRCQATGDQGKRLLLSFHGIPRSYAEAGDPYGEQCQRSSSLLAEELGLEGDSWQVAFQSRFGPQEWLQPYTDKTLQAWARAGVRRVQVICPGFATDCLETLQEIDIEARKTFLEAGGREFQYIPALNDHPDHIRALAEITLSNIQDWIEFLPSMPEMDKREKPVEVAPTAFK
jgi:ferrochelatase